jgi:nucleotide-binding universal stress UspA family protein
LQGIFTTEVDMNVGTPLESSTHRAKPLRAIQMIVVGYDGGKSSERALDRAADLAEKLGARLVVATVEELAVPANAALYGVAAGGVPLALPDELPEELSDLHDEQLERARQAAQARGVSFELDTERAQPVEGILDIAEKHAADLIVVGTHEPGFIERLFFGSVCDEVSRKAHCDVLVVHPAASD